MFVLGLITCVALTAFGAQAKVVDSFEECKEFFYKGKEPSGMDQNAKKICQKLENTGFYYATLYSVYHKIPLYSAYILDPACSRDSERKDIWHLEPQLSQSTPPHMVHEDQNTQNLYRGNQAISRDYSNTGYDRGHLNPSSFQCSDGRTATFTLTNAAPMKERFNRVHWNRWERMLRRYLIQKLISDGGLATAFIVTGTEPDPNVRIPGTRRVTVPSHIWTAVCYKHHFDDTKSFSFRYIGRNQQEEPDIKLTSVAGIFADDCFALNNEAEVQNVFQKLFNLPVNQAVQLSSNLPDLYLAVKRTFNDDGTPGKRVRVDENTGRIAFESMSSYYDVAEHLKVFTKSTCVITSIKHLNIKSVHDELKKRELAVESKVVECQLVPEDKTAVDGLPCDIVEESDYSCRCYPGGLPLPCCSSPCLYVDKLNGYRCYSDRKLIECSPPYSLIPVEGERCMDKYPCATYGRDYFWCININGAPKRCSPPQRSSKTKNGQYCHINYACAKYDEQQQWCYTDEGSKDLCCISDDCHSAVDGQTCRSDHPCGYHGYSYLWCYTDDKDNWNYCCSNCSQ